MSVPFYVSWYNDYAYLYLIDCACLSFKPPPPPQLLNPATGGWWLGGATNHTKATF